MSHFICRTCGTQFADSAAKPDACPICEDERQYVGWEGQQWTTLAEVQQDYHNVIKPLEENLTAIGTHPKFAIGQRALLVQTPAGNLLWDCVTLLDAPTIAALESLGGIRAIAISHPHYYSTMVEWSRVFDAPVFLHAADRQWVMRPDEPLHFWDGETEALWAGMTLIRAGGHFEGGTVLHWPAGANGQGALLAGDILQVVADRRYVSFMYSYPNYIPLPAREVRRIAAAVAPYDCERIYGAFWNRNVVEDGSAAVTRSAERYIQALEE